MQEHIDFKTKITRERPYKTYREDFRVDECGERKLLYQLESDRGRIINSPAIRRLQQKTQVFPLERNAAVRSRLTHSLEVQQTGRYIIRSIFEQLGDDAKRYGLEALERALESVVEMACLAHDIGNPPFGHFGEHAISTWFDEHLDGFECFIGAHDKNVELEAKMIRDLCRFEGNAQAIRLIAKLLRLNLTYTQTACLLKYVRPAYENKPRDGTPGAYLKKKPGFYLSEVSFIDDLYRALNMASGSRHPATYIMEAADDISYCLADIEDAVEKGILDINRLHELLLDRFAELWSVNDSCFKTTSGMKRSFQEIVDYSLERADKDEINRNSEFFVWLRVNLIHPLVQHAANRFIDNMDKVYEGTFDAALMEDESPFSAAIEALKKVAFSKVFNDREVETLELQGYRIIYGLIDFYAPLLKCNVDEFMAILDQEKKAPAHLRRLASRLANRHEKAYRLAIEEMRDDNDFALWEFYYRCRMLQDFISGMTDQFARDEYRTLAVIE